MKYWAGLFPEETRNLVVAGTDLMVRVTKGILDGTRPVKRLKLLTGGDGCRDQPSALAGIDRRLLLGSTASCKVSSTNGNYTRRLTLRNDAPFRCFSLLFKGTNIRVTG
jgi:hypothetical protein